MKNSMTAADHRGAVAPQPGPGQPAGRAAHDAGLGAAGTAVASTPAGSVSIGDRLMPSPRCALGVIHTSGAELLSGHLAHGLGHDAVRSGK